MLIKTGTKTFVNSYGYSEPYTYKELESSLTGHCNRGSAFESSDSCGTCDGARCHVCREIFTVTQFTEPHLVVDDEFGYSYQQTDVVFWKRFTNREEAVEFYSSL